MNMTTLSQHAREIVPASLSTDPSAVFQAAILPVLEDVRNTLIEVVEAVTPPSRRATDLQRTLDLDKHLSWSVFNVVHSPEAYSVATLLPGERAMARFLDRALANGVSSPLIERARQSITNFEASVKLHAGTREMFEAMAASLASENEALESEIDVKNRKAAFRIASVLWGRQTQQRISCLIVHPSATPGLIDRVRMTGTVGFRQNKPGLPLQLQGYAIRTPGAGDPATVKNEPLEPASTGHEPANLLPRFCSQPMPLIERTHDERGNTVYQCIPKSLGALGETTLFVGEIERACASIPGLVPNSELSYAVGFGGPVELGLIDMLIHKSIWNDQLPEVARYAISILDGSKEFRESDRLPIREKVSYLGRGLQAARTPEVPRHSELLAYAFERTGWNPEEFSLFRSRIEYPLMHTRVRYTFKR